MKAMLPLRNERGFTLIELLLAAALLGMMAAAVTGIYYSGARTWQRSIERMDCRQSARIALDMIVSNLRFADWVKIQSGGEIRFKLKGDYNHHDLLNYRRFYLVGEQLILQEKRNGSNYSYNVVAMGIKEICFSMDETNSVHLVITAAGDCGEVTLRSGISPRNLSAETP